MVHVRGDGGLGYIVGHEHEYKWMDLKAFRHYTRNIYLAMNCTGYGEREGFMGEFAVSYVTGSIIAPLTKTENIGIRSLGKGRGRNVMSVG